MKKTIFILSLVVALLSCGEGSNEPVTTGPVTADSTTADSTTADSVATQVDSAAVTATDSTVSQIPEGREKRVQRLKKYEQ
jgi:hypothetical protein